MASDASLVALAEYDDPDESEVGEGCPLRTSSRGCLPSVLTSCADENEVGVRGLPEELPSLVCRVLFADGADRRVARGGEESECN